MTATLTAICVGKVLHLDAPMTLEPNTRVQTTIESIKPDKKINKSFLRTARLLNLDGPLHWSARFEDYLYSSEDERTLSR